MRPELKPVEGLSLSDMAPQEVNIPDYTVTLVPENYINTVWDDAKPLLMGGVDKSNDRWSIETLYYALMQGEQHMWVAFDEDKNITSVLTTQFITYPTKLSLAIQFAGGLTGPIEKTFTLKRTEKSGLEEVKSVPKKNFLLKII